MKFSKDRLHSTLKEWSKVLFSDKSKVCMFGNDGILYTRRLKGERFAPKYQTPIVKHDGGNIIVRGSFSRDSIGPLYRNEGYNGSECVLRYNQKCYGATWKGKNVFWLEFPARQ